MISISTAVTIVIYLIVGGICFGLLMWLVNYCGAQFPQAGPFIPLARVLLVVLAVLVCIGIVLSLVGGVPLFRP